MRPKRPLIKKAARNPVRVPYLYINKPPKYGPNTDGIEVTSVKEADPLGRSSGCIDSLSMALKAGL